MGVLRDLRFENNTVTTRAVGRRLRTFLVQSFLLSMPEQKSPDGYTALLSKWCPAMDREERAQHLLAYSKWVPKPKKKRVRPGNNKPQGIPPRSAVLPSRSHPRPWMRCGQCGSKSYLVSSHDVTNENSYRVLGFS